MATPVVDLPRRRLRDAGLTEEQADVISGAFELLSERIRGLELRMLALEGRMGHLEVKVNILIGLVTGLIVLMAAPYLGITVESGGVPRAVRPGLEHEGLKRGPGSEHERARVAPPPGSARGDAPRPAGRRPSTLTLPSPARR